MDHFRIDSELFQKQFNLNWSRCKLNWINSESAIGSILSWQLSRCDPKQCPWHDIAAWFGDMHKRVVWKPFRKYYMKAFQKILLTGWKLFYFHQWILGSLPKLSNSGCPSLRVGKFCLPLYHFRTLLHVQFVLWPYFSHLRFLW